MEWVISIIQLLEEENFISTCIRIFFATFCGGVLGIERGKANQPAGARTHILVCLGSALVMLTGQYMYNQFNTGDPARLGAQVISGIGFLGAGSIIVAGKTKIRGLTTAAGLWVSACIGLAIGIGFYSGGIVATITVYLVVAKFRSLSDKFTHNDTWFGIYVELNSMSTIPDFCSTAEAFGLTIGDIQMNKSHNIGSYSAIIYMKNPTKKNQDEIMEYLKILDGIEDIKFIL